MIRRGILGLLLVACCTQPSTASAVSAVFNGDPTDPTSGAPWEMLPGKPLVRPGGDGLLGTFDDVVTPALVGDIDLVVRAGAVSATAAIPAPALAGDRAALPVGVAGPSNAGGREIPFTVFLSNGVTSGGEPAGRLLAAADMDGIPVIVSAFADLDGDGVIGPTAQGSDAARALRLRELVPVGRAAALFSGGVAHGAIAVQRGLPPSRGGLTVALVAMALTGPFDAAFFDGAIPSGPAIATALPFLPQRDLNRLIRDRAVPAGPGTTLQQVIQFAAAPAADTYALPLDGSEASIDGAVVRSQPAVRVALRDALAPRGIDLPLSQLTLGTERFTNLALLRLVPVDRFDNLADAPLNWAVRVLNDGPLRILSPRLTRRGQAAMLRRGALRVAARVPSDAVDGATGTIRVERDGIVVATLPYTVSAGANQARADVVVPSNGAATIQAGVDAASDRNADGRIIVRVRAGLYREHVVIPRAMELVGEGSDLTIIQGDGSAPVVSTTAAGVVVRGVTALGGTRGFQLGGQGARLLDSTAWRNLAEGVLLASPAVEVRRCDSRENGGDGVRMAAAANGALCADSWLRDNGGTGGSTAATPNGQWVANRAARNGTGGLVLQGAGGATLTDNRSVLNYGSGIFLLDAPNADVVDNLCALNDENGLHVESSDGVVATGNVLDDNHGYGIFLRRSAATDFAAAAGAQLPPGDNAASGNRKADVFVRPD